MNTIIRTLKCVVLMTIALAYGSAVSAKATLVGINDVRGGSLLFATQTEGRHVPAPLLATDVDISISGPVARVKVRQTFLNPSKHWLEGRYVFSLPQNSAVHHMVMRSQSREIIAEIKEKEAARKIYRQAQQSGRRAALIEQHRPNIFTTAIANLAPGDTIDVEISYLQRVRYDQGQFTLRFPMVVAPRFTPKPPIQMVDARGDKLPALPGSEPKLPLAPVLHPDEGKLNPVKLAIHLNAGVPLAHLSSPHHQIVASNWQGGESEITLGDGVVPADRDFELIWAPVPSAKPVMALFQERLDDETFMLAMVMPPAAEQAPPPMARDVVFVLDRSGSMAGSSIRQARKALVFALERLRPEDRFNIIRFDNKTETFFPALRTATKNIVRRAIDYVRGTEARGGTNMRPALLAALAGTPADSRLRQIIFLTDAAIGNEAALFDAIASRIGQNRLFTVGIGSAPNSYFMQRAAELGRGSFTYIGNTQKVGDTMQALFRKIERPMATALSVQWDGLPTDTHRIETYPNRLPDLYDGGPIVLAARIVGPDPLARASALTISGTVDTAPWRQTIDLAAAKPVIGGGTLWGRAKISNLMMSIHQGADPASVKQAVTVTALRHHIVSRYTSLVATEKEVTRPADEPIFPRTVPRNLPDGWDFEKVFGDVLKTKPASIVPISTPPVPPAADKLRHAGLAVHKAARRGAPAKQLASVAKPRLSSNPTSSPMALASRTVRLPAGSTSAALNLIVGIIALLVGIILMRRKRMS